MKRYVYVNNLWKDAEFTRLKGVDRLAYRSNKLGADQRITNTGGGNTSSKLLETDPLTGRKVEVFWVKGSGGDLRTVRRQSFWDHKGVFRREDLTTYNPLTRLAGRN
jgi:rhamnose utilization protein RhaD (predicted bifunctional aldolase and dehydrogenase)